MGSLARAGSEARPGSEQLRPAASLLPVPATGQNTTLPAHSDLRLRSLRKNGYVLGVSG